MADELCLKNRIKVLPVPNDDLDLEESNDSSPKPYDEGRREFQQEIEGDELRFRYGLYFYTVTRSQNASSKPLNDASKFDVRGRLQVELASKLCQKTHDERSSDCRMRLKSISLEFPTSSASYHIRNKENLIVEWGRVSFNRAFHADQAFEIVVKWFMSTGQTVADLVHKQW